MDLRILEKSPGMAPMLVKLYESQKLYDLASDQSPAARGELTGAIVELLEKDLGLRERELVSDVLINLMRQAEKDLRQALSDRLATMDNAPLRVILHIANDEISIARPVLQSSTVLSDLDLLYIIKSKTPEYWQEIAQRSELHEQVMNTLAETQDKGTVLALAENAQISLSQKVFSIIGSMAQNDQSLAKPLLMRADVPEILARHLYEYVGEELKAYISTSFGAQSKAVTNAINDVIQEFTEGPRNQFMPTAPMLQAADILAETGRLNATKIMDALQRAQFGTFIALFSRYCGITPQKVYEMVTEPSARTLALTCRAIHLSKADLARIYMMTQRVRSEERVVNHKEMLQAMAIFEETSLETAQSLTGIQQK